MSRLEPCDTSKSLLLRVRSQDDAAWREFFQIYTPVVYGYAMRRGLESNDAEDVTQEVLLEVVRSIQKFEYQSEKGRFRDWLGTIVWRRIIRFWKAKASTVNLHDNIEESEATDPEWVDVFQHAILKQSLSNIKSQFAEITWNAFLAVWQEGYSPLLVSQQLGIPIEVVYNAKSRVLKKLEAEVLRVSDDHAWIQSE
jgi:RNA polymerase sigma factor (sigma-70 family)